MLTCRRSTAGKILGTSWKPAARLDRGWITARHSERIFHAPSATASATQGASSHVRPSDSKGHSHQGDDRRRRRQAAARVRVREYTEFDPFLLLDDFRNDNPADYL